MEITICGITNAILETILPIFFRLKTSRAVPGDHPVTFESRRGYNTHIGEVFMRLNNGSRVVIIGGGPAGCFTALHLLRLASENDLQLDIRLYEPRDFKRPGPGGCNKCAGILSSTLVQNLEILGLSLPPEVIQSDLTAYVLHMGEVEMRLSRPDARRRIVSIYRGGGPRLGSPPFPGSFDDWLLDQVRQRGIQVIRERVEAVRPGERPLVITGKESDPADLVVLATGVNSRAPLDPTWKYIPPQAEIMAQDEVSLPKNILDSQVHIYFDHPAGLIFGGVIPKGRYANVSLLGHNLPPRSVKEFLIAHNLAKTFPNGMALCGCTPQVAVTAAENYFTDRLVAVGDAAVTRLYKDGIGAAFITAESAARTAVQRGVSQRDFSVGFHPTCRRISMDNRYGKMLFRLWEISRHTPFLLDVWQEAIMIEADLPPEKQIHSRTLWNMFTGDEPYRKILWQSFSLPAMLGLFKGLVRQWKRK